LPRVGLPLIVLLCGVAATGALYATMRHSERRTLEARFEAIAEDRFEVIDREIEVGLKGLHSVGAFYAASEKVEPEEFRAFVTPLLARLRQVRAFAWAPRVPAADRAAFEQAAQDHGWPALRVRERGPSAAPVDAGPREEYFPVAWVEPWTGNEAVLGLDLASEPAHARALLAARASGDVAATEAVAPPGESDGRSCVILALPVYGDPGGVDAPDARRTDLSGFIVAVLAVEDLVERALSRLSPQWVDICLRDVTDASNPTPLYTFTSRLRADRGGGPLGVTPADGDPTRVATLNVAGRTWEVSCTAAPQFARVTATWHSTAILIGGILASIMASGYTRTLVTRQATISRVVVERTEELARSAAALERANAHLEESIAEQQRAREEMDRFFTLSLDLLCIADTHGYFKRLSLAWEKTLGFTHEELLSRPYIEFVHPDDREATAVEAANVAGGIDVVSFENRYLCRDGSYRWLRWSSTAAPDGKTCYAAARDVTEQRRTEQDLVEAKQAAERANRAKGEFLATMSHELRTPLNGVIGMTELLLGTELDAQQRRYAWLAKCSGETLLSLISDVLDFSKIEAGRLELERLDFNPQYAIENVVAILASRAQQKGLEIACRVHPGVPQAVVGDPGRFQQILMNLLGNAIKFTERGEVVVRATRDHQTDSRAVVRVTVTDTGIGIPADRLGHVFESFTQADASTTRKHGGTGLGLAIARQLAELMEGQMGVESTVGAGSTFWFTASFEKPPSASRQRDPIPEDLRRISVLIVDDNATNREVLCEQLEGMGIRAQAAPDPGSALETLRQAAHDGAGFTVALLDMRMPQMDGRELARTIKADRAVQNTVLVLLSSQMETFDGEELRRCGFSACLQKPVRESDLIGTLAEALACAAAAPLDPARATPPSDPGKEAPRSRYPGARVLLAEDHEISQEVAVAMLARAGFKCEAVGDGRRAVEAALSGRFDLVLMDCQMPGMDGFDAARAIREAEATHGLSGQAGAHIPIVAATANALQGDRERCVAAGMDDYVSKPFVASQLVHVIDAQLAQHRSEVSRGGRPAAAPRRPAPFNRDALRKRWGDDRKLIDRLITLFRTRTSIETDQLQEAIDAGDAVAVGRFAHGLKGAASYVEAQQVRALAEQIETLARDGDLDGIPALFAGLRDELVRCAAPDGAEEPPLTAMKET